ncbi:MAG: hypothetical protein Q4B37_09190 [Eubacteriales bacterium]|nr:hypothetical protein [Eubacteriales bacterium]
MKKKTKLLYEKLKKFKEYSVKSNEWPGTITMDDDHIYKFVCYRAEMDIAGFLLRRMSRQRVYIRIKKKKLRNLQLLEQN